MRLLLYLRGLPGVRVWKEPGHSPGPQAENVRYETPVNGPERAITLFRDVDFC